MAEVKDVTLEINIESKAYEKQLEKCNYLAESLNTNLKKLQSVEIGLNIVRIKKKWYQFWK